eukprot:3436188-Amphidinium_carterae.2
MAASGLCSRSRCLRSGKKVTRLQATQGEVSQGTFCGISQPALVHGSILAPRAGTFGGVPLSAIITGISQPALLWLYSATSHCVLMPVEGIAKLS